MLLNAETLLHRDALTFALRDRRVLLRPATSPGGSWCVPMPSVRTCLGMTGQTWPWHPFCWYGV